MYPFAEKMFNLFTFVSAVPSLMKPSSITRFLAPHKTAAKVAAWMCCLLATVGNLDAANRTVGSGMQHATIAAAITASIAGDTITISAGSYTETLTVNKANLILVAAAGSKPVLNGRISVNAHNVTIRGLEITNWGTTAAHGIYAYNVNGLTVDQCEIHDGPNAGSSSGVYARNGYGILISNNEIYRCVKGVNIVSGRSLDSTYENGVIIRGNNIHNNPIDGINVHGSYITIEDNTIADNLDTNWVATHPDGIQLIAATVDSQTSVKHCRILRNTVKNHTQNIFTEGVGGGDLSDCEDIHIANNVVYCDPGTVNGVDLDAIATKNICIKKSKNVSIFNNTLGPCTNNGILLQNCSTQGLIEIKNNIVASQVGAGIWAESASFLAPGTLNYNFYGSNSNALRLGSTYYQTLATLPLAFGHEANGLSGNPLTGALPTPTLADNSPCKAVGLTMPSLYAKDRAGNVRSSSDPWDIGAYKFTPAPRPAQVSGLRILQ